MKKSNLFNGKAENFLKFRPGYPDKIIGVMEKDMAFDSTFDIADIGSGTGALSKIFLQNENLVFGVEPNDEMRALAEKQLSKYYNFISIKGTAEKTNLADLSVDLITAAQSFHWFDSDEAKNEFMRILRKEGHIMVVWNLFRKSNTGFLKSFTKYIEKINPELFNLHIQVSDQEKMKEFFGSKSHTVKTLDNYQILDWTGLKGFVQSISFFPEDSKEQITLTEELKRIYDKYNVNSKIIIDYSTKLYIGKIK